MPTHHHVNLGVPEGGLPAQMDWLEKLGYRRIPAPPEVADRANWFEGDDGGQIHLSVDPDHRPAARAHVAVVMGDQLDQAAADLGVGVSDGLGIRIANVQDPSGNRWELRSRA